MTPGTREQRDGDQLEREADALVDIFNAAAPGHAQELRWFAMDHDHETGTEAFVLEAESYIDSDGLAALREAGREVRYIEGYEADGDVRVTISVPVQGEVPDPEGT